MFRWNRKKEIQTTIMGYTGIMDPLLPSLLTKGQLKDLKVQRLLHRVYVLHIGLTVYILFIGCTSGL